MNEMHTVIILNKQSSDLLKDFRFLYKPFVDEGTISFCDWNEAGTDLKSAVPDIYKCIKGKPDWQCNRAEYGFYGSTYVRTGCR